MWTLCWFSPQEHKIQYCNRYELGSGFCLEMHIYIYKCNRISTSGHQSFTNVISPLSPKWPRFTDRIPQIPCWNPGTTSERGQVATLDGGGDLNVSENGGTPKSSILIGFSIINHPFWGKTPYFWKHPFGTKSGGRSWPPQLDTNSWGPTNSGENTWVVAQVGRGKLTLGMDVDTFPLKNEDDIGKSPCF